MRNQIAAPTQRRSKRWPMPIAIAPNGHQIRRSRALMRPIWSSQKITPAPRTRSPKTTRSDRLAERLFRTAILLRSSQESTQRDSRADRDEEKRPRVLEGQTEEVQVRHLQPYPDRDEPHARPDRFEAQ